MRAPLTILATILVLNSCYRHLALPQNAHWNREPGVFDWGLGSITLPHGFYYQQDQGIDSFVGHFASVLHSVVVKHDIGAYAGSFANPRTPDFYREFKVGGARVRIAMRAQQYPNHPRHFFAVTFPDSGLANFYFASNDPADSLLLDQIARSYRPHPLPRH